MSRLAGEFLWSSQLDLAYAAAQEGYRLSLDLGYGSGGYLVSMAAIEATWGREEDARRHAEEALAQSQRRGSAVPPIAAEWVLGLIELVVGRPAEAAERPLAITTPDSGQAAASGGASAEPDSGCLVAGVRRRR